MRIAVNTRLLIKNKLEGIGWFTFETLRRIVVQHPQVEFYFFFDRKPDPEFLFAPNVKAVVLRPQARHPMLFVIWFEWSVARALRQIEPDLFLSPDGYISLSAKVPTLAVIHDLNFEHFPEDLPWLVRHYYRYFFPRFAKSASRIATVSEFSRSDIVLQYKIDPAKIDVVYNGVNELFAPISASEVIRVRAQHSQSCPYFLFVGSLQPRKNLARLFTAFDKFKQKDSHGVKLMVVGEKKWWTPEIRSAYEAMTFQDEVIFAGRLEPETLRYITAAAMAMVYISYFEGFGIPIIEAFRSGVPVITASRTATLEVAGHAAALVDPFDIDDIAKAMLSVSKDEGFRQRLIANGLERAMLFSWQQAADKLWQTMVKTMAEAQ